MRSKPKKKLASGSSASASNDSLASKSSCTAIVPGSLEPFEVSTWASQSSVQDSPTSGCSSARLSGARSLSLFGLRNDVSNAQQAVGAPFPRRPVGCKLSAETWLKLERLFRMMDVDNSNAVTKAEAQAFFTGAFARLSADAMFNELDEDGSGAVTADEFVAFWLQVRRSGYKEDDIQDELDELLSGGAWVDWHDGRTTHEKEVRFPTRPILCKVSGPLWAKCEQLYRKIDSDGALSITREKAEAFFVGAFGNVSADAMFNEVDVNHHGIITPKAWMVFWKQVRASGYTDKDVMEEIDNLLDGNPWVDWKDGRTT